MTQPSTEPAEVLADIWCSALGRDRVGADDSFFSIGGESLAAAYIVTHISQRMSVDISLREFYRDGTFGNCLARVRDLLAGQAPAPAESSESTSLLENDESLEDREVPDQADRRCSIAQEWLLGMSEQPSQEGIANFIAQQAITLRGTVDVGQIRRALSTVAERHELLRATFVRDNGTACLRIAPEGRIELREHQIADARLGTIGEAVAEAFDRYSGPMARCHLFEVGPQLHVLVFVLDQIICDGLSLGLLLRDFSAAYAGAELQPVATSFTTWSAAQRRIELAGVRDYWRDRLGDDPTIVATPFRDHRAVRMERSAGATLTLTRSQSQNIRAAASRRNLTVYSLILGAFLVALRDRVTQARFCVVTTIANRGTGTEETFGPLAHDAYVPVDLSDSSSLEALAQQAQESTVETTSHSVVPNTTILELLWPGTSDNLVGAPSFYFSYNTNWSENLQLPGVRSADVQTEPHMPMPGIECTVVDTKERITINLRYLAGSFPPGYVDAIGSEVLDQLSSA